MAVATFDTLKFANTLKAAGVPPEQAEAQAHILADALQVNFKDLATKEDVAAVRADVDRAVKELRTEIERVAKDGRRELEQAVERLERKIAEESQKLNARLDTFQAKHAGDMVLIKWMLTAIITIGGGILIRLFFFRGM